MIINNSTNNDIFKTLNYECGVLAIGTIYDNNTIGENAVNMHFNDFQIWINIMLRIAIIKKNVENVEKLLKYLKAVYVGPLNLGHPFMHEAAHQGHSNIIIIIWENIICKNYLNNQMYYDKYGFTANQRLLKRIQNVPDKYDLYIKRGIIY